ncbi:MAG TPA: redoxin domain-containing protein [Pirellulaceae bacterium]
MRHLLSVLILLPFLLAASQAKEPAFELSDISGKVHTPFADPRTRAVVLVFITKDCPIANYFQPTLQRLEASYKDKGIIFYLIHSDPDTTQATAGTHAKEYAITAPVIVDPRQKLAKEFEAEWTPEAVVILPDRKTTFRGRIDDTYADYGKKRPRPTRNDLKEAIDAVLAGKIPDHPVTSKPVGCPIYFPK